MEKRFTFFEHGVHLFRFNNLNHLVIYLTECVVNRDIGELAKVIVVEGDNLGCLLRDECDIFCRLSISMLEREGHCHEGNGPCSSCLL